MGDETVTRGGTALTPCNLWKLPRLFEWYTIEHFERSKRSHDLPGCEMLLVDEEAYLEWLERPAPGSG
jgi:hypothetical protein